MHSRGFGVQGEVAAEGGFVAAADDGEGVEDEDADGITGQVMGLAAAVCPDSG